MKTRIDIEGPDEVTALFSRPVKEVSESILARHETDDKDITVSFYLEFVDDRYILEVNKTYRNVDKTTDVLSFPALNCKEGTIIYNKCDIDYENNELFLGDILIATSKIYSQAESYNHSPLRECVFLASHGLLHLLGYDHEDKRSEEVMMAIQEEVLKELNYER